MTWQALEHARRSFTEGGDPNDAAGEAKYMSRGWLVKARFPTWPDGMHNVSWFWVPIGNCTACRFFRPLALGGQSCTNPNAAIRERFFTYVNTNVCPGFVAGESDDALAAEPVARDTLDMLRAAGLADGEPNQPVEILQKLAWTPWRSHQARAQQDHFLSMARSHDFGQDERMHGQDVGDIER